MDAQIEHVLRELDRHEIPRTTLVGHSVGGAVAMLTAAAHPDRVDAVVNIEGNFTLADAFWSGKVARMSPEEADALVAGFRNDVPGWLAGQRIAANPQRIAWAGRMFDAQPASSVRALAQAVVDATGRSDYLARIEGVLDSGIPVHLMAGERSRAGWAVPEAFLRRAASMTIQRGVGHMMVLEDGEGFLALVASLC
jgi:pimeloyl-ACP methyl ester carboxylesterase